MHVFEARPKKWGNSMGITIPKEIVEKAQISGKKKITIFITQTNNHMMDKIFGSLPKKSSKSTQEIMDEIDEGYDEH